MCFVAGGGVEAEEPGEELCGIVDVRGGEVVEDDEDNAEVDHVDEHCAVGFEYSRGRG